MIHYHTRGNIYDKHSLNTNERGLTINKKASFICNSIDFHTLQAHTRTYLTHHFLRKVQRFRTHHFKQTLSTCIISQPHIKKDAIMDLHNCFIEVIIRCIIFPIAILYIIVLKPYLTHHFLRKVQRFRTNHFKQTLSTCIISTPHITKGCYHDLT